MGRPMRISAACTLTTLLEYLLMGLVLLYSSMWSVFTPAQSNTFLRLAYPVLLLLLALRLRVIPRRMAQGLCLLAAALAVFLLGSHYNPVRYLLYFAGPLLLLALYQGAKSQGDAPLDLPFKLERIIFWLTAFSLVCFFFGTLLGVLPGGRTITYFFANQDRSCTTYFHLYYEAQTITLFGRELVRNCGIFAEAPGFAVFLVVGLAVELFLRPRARVWRCAVYAVAAVTTFSTKALLLVMLALGLRYVIYRPQSPIRHRAKAILLPLAGVAGLFAAAFLLVEKSGSESFAIRLDDLAASGRAFLTSPLFGTGYYNDGAIIQQFRYPRPNNGLSMGLAVLLAQGGLFLFGVYVTGAVLCLRRCAKSWRPRWIAFLLTYCGLLFVSNIPFSFLAVFLLAFSWQTTLSPAIDKEIVLWETASGETTSTM